MSIPHFFCGRRGDDGKLFSGVTAQQVDPAKIMGKQARNLLEHLVAQGSLGFGGTPVAESQKKLDDSVNDKAEPKIDDQSQIETGRGVPSGYWQVGRDHEQVEDIADYHGNQGFPKVRLEHLVRMPPNRKTAKIETT